MKEIWKIEETDFLMKAIHSYEFEKLPVLCDSLNLKLKKIINIVSNSDTSILVETPLLLVKKNLDETVHQALDFMFLETTKKTFELKNLSSSNPNVSIGNYQAEIECLLQNLEQLSRHVIKLIEKGN